MSRTALSSIVDLPNRHRSIVWWRVSNQRSSPCVSSAETNPRDWRRPARVGVWSSRRPPDRDSQAPRGGALRKDGRSAADPRRSGALERGDPISARVGAAALRKRGLAVWPLRAASKSPEYAIEARMLLARSMLESRTAPDAIPFIDEMLELEPENIPALVLRIQAYQGTRSQRGRARRHRAGTRTRP